MATETIVVVGASLAGTRAAEALRDEGFSGRLVLVGEEPWAPYDRPPLSKQVLSGEWDHERTLLLAEGEWADLDVEFRLGVRATGVDTAERLLRLDSGGPLGYDGLVLATGARPRPLAGLALPAEGVHLLRTRDDAIRLARSLHKPGRRLGIIGGGFIGSEVASVALGLGHHVVVMERSSGPMAEVLGSRVSTDLARLQHDAGVELRTGFEVVGIEPASLPGGEVLVRGRTGDPGEQTLRFDAVLVCVGAVPNVEWLAGSGLTVDAGLVCDPALFAADGVVGAGDVVRIRREDGVLHRRVEHWTDAARQAEVAVANLLAGPALATEFSGLPYVWSDQFGVRIEVIGDPGATDDVVVETDGHSRLYRCSRNGVVVAYIGVDAARRILELRRAAPDQAALGAARVAPSRQVES